MLADDGIVEALNDNDPVGGLTHDFYRYPARFSPRIARELIERFTTPGDLVLDPFMGGGTALVEAFALGRNAIGSDVSSLAVFVARVKTTLLSEKQLRHVMSWGERAAATGINLSRPVRRHLWWRRRGYQRYLPWRVRKMLEQSLNSVGCLHGAERSFARCALLKTAQWAIDCKPGSPQAERFRRKLRDTVNAMTSGMRTLNEAVASWKNRTPSLSNPHIVNTPAESINAVLADGAKVKAKLIVTSPPYPGVHVLYHRWQIASRRETSAPFWIAGCLDGHGGAHYTLGDRKRRDRSYFDRVTVAFSAIRKVVADDSMVAQIVGFNRPDEQLPLFLEAMESAGFEDISLCDAGKKLWRSVPNRKWYTHIQKIGNASSEVLLLHRPRRLV